MLYTFPQSGKLLQKWLLLCCLATVIASCDSGSCPDSASAGAAIFLSGDKLALFDDQRVNASLLVNGVDLYESSFSIASAIPENEQRNYGAFFFDAQGDKLKLSEGDSYQLISVHKTRQHDSPYDLACEPDQLQYQVSDASNNPVYELTADCTDSDSDSVLDVHDNCVFQFNPEQSDSGGISGFGDRCEYDSASASQADNYQAIDLMLIGDSNIYNFRMVSHYYAHFIQKGRVVVNLGIPKSSAALWRQAIHLKNPPSADLPLAIAYYNYLRFTQPRLIMIALGTNDFTQGHSDTSIINDLMSLLRKLRSYHPDARIIVAYRYPYGPGFFPAYPSKAYPSDLYATFVEPAIDEGLMNAFIDTHALMGGVHYDAVAQRYQSFPDSDAEPQVEHYDSESLSYDDGHFNEAGFFLFAYILDCEISRQFNILAGSFPAPCTAVYLHDALNAYMDAQPALARPVSGHELKLNGKPLYIVEKDEG